VSDDRKHGIDGQVYIAQMEGELNWEAIGFLAPEPEPEPVRSLDVVIKGKRIWWKPWRRRPDKSWHFPAVRISDNGDGSLSFDVVPESER
jgi:hypothetical protein